MGTSALGSPARTPVLPVLAGGEITSSLMETRKICIDYAITITSASDFYVSNTSVSSDADLITIDATSSDYN
jgi:hypothetical protein